jgi:hypothetical protein
MNSTKEGSLFSYIHRQWSSLIPSFNAERIEYAFKSGKFVLLLDGLDEIDHTIRDDICRQILLKSDEFSLPFLRSWPCAGGRQPSAR